MPSRRCARSAVARRRAARRGRRPGASAPARVGRRAWACESASRFTAPSATWRRSMTHRLSVAHADHRSVRARRDRGGGARLPRRGGRASTAWPRPSPTASAAARSRRRCRLSRYVELGGRLDGLPQCVYDPAPMRSSSRAPSIPSVWPRRSPRVFADARGFEALSAAASAHVLAQPSFAAHVRDVMAVIDG